MQSAECEQFCDPTTTYLRPDRARFMQAPRTLRTRFSTRFSTGQTNGLGLKCTSAYQLSLALQSLL